MNAQGELPANASDGGIAPTRMVGGTSQYGSESGDGSLIDFVELRAIVLRNKWWIAGTVLLTLILAAILTSLAVPMYRAETTLEVDSRQSNILDVEDVEAETVGRDNSEFLQTQLEILRSRASASAVAEDLGLLDNNAFLATMNVAPPSEDLEGRALADARRNKVVNTLLANQKVTLVPQSRIVGIEFTSPSGRVAASVANSYAENYIEDSLTRRFNVSRYAREFVGEQLEQARENLENSEKNLNTYARNAGIISTETNAEGQPQGSLTASTISQTNQDLIEARSDRIAAEQSWRAVQNTPALSIPAVYSNSAVSVLLRRRAELRAQLAEANARYIDSAPQVEEARSELSQIESELNSLAGEIKNSIRRGYDAAIGREQQLEEAVSGLTARQQEEQNLGVQYNILNREVATNRVLYDGLLQRFRELTASAGLTGNNITVVDEAQLPRAPYSPQPVRNMLIALVLGLILAGIVTFLREQILQRVRTPDDARRLLDLPLLAAVPKPSGVTMAEALEENLSNVSEAMSTFTSVLALSSENGFPKSMFITSGRSAEGKSSTNYAVARNLARRGSKVLVIDADMRRPNMHNLFGVKNTSGLSDVLAGQRELADTVNEGVTHHAIDFLPAGHIPPNPVDLLSTARLGEVITRAKARYDHVLIDGPPVLGLSDALIIASNVDATVFAIESGAWRPSQARDMIRRLSQNARSLVGLVLTKFDARGVGYEYYYNESEYEYRPSTD